MTETTTTTAAAEKLAALRAELAALTAANPELLTAEANRKAAVAARAKELREKARAAAHEAVRKLAERTCACGCGGRTKSTFVPGHDAKLHARLTEEIFAKLVVEAEAAAA